MRIAHFRQVRVIFLTKVELKLVDLGVGARDSEQTRLLHLAVFIRLEVAGEKPEHQRDLRRLVQISSFFEFVEFLGEDVCGRL